MPGALSGLTVVDLSWGTAGPITTMLLSDHGAEVIKVEPPGGDPFRRALGYQVWNRGKKSVTLDLKAEEDRQVFLGLVGQADVLVESFRPGVMDRLGLGYHALRDTYPGLVYCSITGYGPIASARDRPGYDALVQARSGMQAEEPGLREGPIFIYCPQPSYGAAYLASIGVTTALYTRELTGVGDWVQTSLLQGILVFARMFNTWAQKSTPQFEGSLPFRMLESIYECGDGLWVHSMQGSAKGSLEAFCPILELPEIEGMQPGVRGMRLSPEARLRVHELAIDAFKKRPRQEWLDAMWAADVPIQKVQPAEAALDEPQAIANKAVATVDDPILGPVKQLGITFHLSSFDPQIQGPPPSVGQHNDEVRKRALESNPPKPLGPPQPRRLAHPLQGVNVLDLGNFLAGPFGPMVMADLGADVIKLEPVEGDPMRSSAKAFFACQRGKRSIAVDLKTPEGVEICHKLARWADVVHHNFRPGVAERLKVDYETVRKLKPDVIYCHTPAYGLHGPWSAWPGLDQLFTAMCGLEEEAGGEGNPPHHPRFGIVDTGNALQSVIAVMMALRHRARTGEGQFVHTSLLSAGLFYNSDAFVTEDGRRRRPRLDARQTGLSPLYRLYETKEGWLCLACPGQGEWESLCRALGGADLARNPSFATEADRKSHAVELAEALEAAFRAKTADEWVEALDEAGVPCEVSSETASRDIFFDPEALQAQLVVESAHPEFTAIRQSGHLINFERMAGRTFRAPPLVGEHSQAILDELGYDAGDAARLKEKGVVTWPW